MATMAAKHDSPIAPSDLPDTSTDALGRSQKLSEPVAVRHGSEPTSDSTLVQHDLPSPVEPAEDEYFSPDQGIKKTLSAPLGKRRISLPGRSKTERTSAVDPVSTVVAAPNARPAPLTRGATYTFDPSDDSDSSSEEEAEHARPQPPPQTDGACESKAQGKPKKSSDSGRPFRRFQVGNEHYNTKGRVSKRDGRLNISIHEAANRGYLAKALGSTIKNHFHFGPDQDGKPAAIPSPGHVELEKIPSIDYHEQRGIPRPKLSIVIMVIGSRGDIQPFIKIGKILQNEHGHRVRIATHPTFRKFVAEDSGLEFFSVGGNPSELMAFMVKNPGLIPSMDTIKAGEIGRRRAQMYEMFNGMWRACINATDDEDNKQNQKMMSDHSPFVADAIIANPPSFAHIHIAERLGIPLHCFFTFPYSPTTQFPHPLANIKATNVDRAYTNFMSYPLVEMMTWQGLGDLVNKFRTETLGLEPVSTLWAPGQLYRLKVPFTYMWSPGLVPKPHDWGQEIDITGFVFLEQASSFKPPADLAKFLEAGPPPVYIGFGSIVVDDADKFTQMIFEAVKLAGVRALVNKGWGGLGGGETPDNILMLGNTPHDWLFPKCAAVVHHGGAGTTAIGLKLAKPTMIVPFFGDQPFWGAMVAKAKAGAHECIPYKHLTTEKLAEGIKQCLTEEAKVNVVKIAESIEKEGDGAANAVRSFHRSLPLRGTRSLRCSILEDRIAVWQLKKTSLRLSALAADLLVEKKKLKHSDLRLLRVYDWNDFEGPGEPVTGVGSAITDSVTGAFSGIGSVPYKMGNSIRKREQHNAKKKRAIRKSMEKQERPPAAANKVEADGPAGYDDRPQPSRQRTNSTTLSKLSADPQEPLAEELAEELGHGAFKTGVSLVNMPLDLSVALAQGFHNAPRLYGDTTVRRPVRINGWKSGLRAAGDEFRFGVYDGVTGLWRLPIQGAQRGGVMGAARGVGMGIGGFVLKDIAAIIGPFAYVPKGVQKQIEKRNQPTHYIRRALIKQGHQEHLALSNASATDDGANERSAIEDRVMKGWDILVTLLNMRTEMQHSGPFFGLGGRIHYEKKRKEWEDAGALESVATAEEALEALKKGVPVKEAMRAQREQVQKAQQPRAGALDRPEEGLNGQVSNGRLLASPEEGKEGNRFDNAMRDRQAQTDSDEREEEQYENGPECGQRDAFARRQSDTRDFAERLVASNVNTISGKM